MRPRRLPFVLVFACAACGIAAADLFEAPAWAAFALAGIGAAGSFQRGIERVCRPEPLAAAVLIATFFGLHQLNWHRSPSRLAGETLVNAGVARDFQVLAKGEPRLASKGRWGFDCIVQRVDGNPCSIRAWAVVPGDPPKPGDILRMRASPLEPKVALNPGQIDIARLLARRGIFVELHARHDGDAEIIERGRLGKCESWLRECRAYLSRVLTLDIEFDPVVSAVILGVVLGADDEVPPDLMEIFQAAGALHLFSVSGLHVGMVGLLAWMVLGAGGVGPRARAGAALCAVWLYAMITGGKIPSVRAAIMASAVAGGILLRREPSPVNSISAAGAVLLAADTNALFQAGFQLSFGAVFALAIFAERLAGPLRKALSPDPLIPAGLVPVWRRWVSEGSIRLAQLFVVSVVAGLGTSIFSAAHFSLVTPGGAFSNMVAVPLAFATLSIGLLSAALNPISGWLSVLANNANWLVTASLVKTTMFFGTQPWSSIPGNPGGWFKPRVEIWVLALEEGGATVLRAGGATWLIGTGSREEYRRVIRPFLRWYGISRLEGLILPQGDARNYGGAERCVMELRPRRIVQGAVHDRSPSRSRFNEWLEKSRIGWEEMGAGERIDLPAGVVLEVVYPPGGLRARMAGERAMVMKVSAAGASALICAEPPFSTQARLADLGREVVGADLAIIGQSRVDPVADPRFIEEVGASVWVWGSDSFRRDAPLRPAGAIDPLKTGAIRARLDPAPLHLEGYRIGRIVLH